MNFGPSVYSEKISSAFSSMRSTFGVPGGQNLHPRIHDQRPLQVVKIAIYFRDNRRVRQARTDFLRYIEGRSSDRNLLERAIRQSDINAHDEECLQVISRGRISVD